MNPLRGEHYSNIFAHYRPIGDPKWYTKSNPPEGPEPLLDIGECKLEYDSGAPVCTIRSLPYLSSKLQVIHSGNDLFQYWKTIESSDDKLISSTSMPNVIHTNSASKSKHSEF
jgi:hypothetical protein